MFIAVDIGNTNVALALLKDTRVVKTFKFDSRILKSKNKACRLIKRHLSPFCLHKEHVEAVYVCSVVSGLNRCARAILKSVFKSNAIFVGEDIFVPIVNRYRISRQVGQDRLVNAYAGLKIYGRGLIIVDFGTAITFDVVSKKSEYLGGLIFPGLKLMQNSLDRGTALLPFVELSRPIEVIGRDTVSSIRAGIVFGTASLCDGIIKQLLKRECKGYKVIVTGGDAPLIKPYSSYLGNIDDLLIFKGLALIHKGQKNKKIST